jgi:hypothetical protein
MAMITAVMASTSAWAQTSAPTDVVDMPLVKAFVPPRGFDNNDDVQIVLTGYMPNVCYRLAATEVVRDEQGKPIGVSQKAEVLRNGICAEQDNLPAHLLEVVPFTTTVSLGRLAAGEYSVSYSRRETAASAVSVATRNFSVVEALVPTVDNIKYANLSSVNVRPVVTEGQSVQAVLSGMLTSGCTDLAPHVQVTRIDDVVIVLPGLSVRENPFCTMMLRPFERTVDLGNFTTDTYLVHARSMSGRAVNSVFTVQPPTVRRR